MAPVQMDRQKMIIVLLYTGFFTLHPLLIKNSSKKDEDGKTQENTGYDYHPANVTLLTELIKFALSFAIFFARNQPTPDACIGHITNIRKSAYYAVPGFVYCVYNIFWFINADRVDPSTLQVLINIRVLFVGVLFQVVFGKKLGLRKWVALFILLAGCVIATFNSEKPMAATFSFIITITFQASLSSLGAVYNEYVLKKDMETDIFLQNMYLYGFSIVFNLLYILYEIGFPNFSFDANVYPIAINSAIGGLFASMFLKYLNSVLKTYAAAVEMLLVALINSWWFDKPLEAKILVAVVFVSFSLYMYNVDPQPQAAYQSVSQGGPAPPTMAELRDLETGRRGSAESKSGKE